MVKRYCIGENRYVKVKKQNGDPSIIIFEEGTEKSVTFPVQRWAQFVHCMSQVDDSIKSLREQQQYVKHQQHIGGRWFVCVTTGYRCVDIRQFYDKEGEGLKPTKKGIAIRLHEWDKLKNLINQIHVKYPKIAAAQPCSYGLDHSNLQGALNCFECNPFQTIGE